jgi:KH domain
MREEEADADSVSVCGLSESEEKADLEIKVPTNKVKLIVGAGGEKIKEIQRKSKCRLQIKKEDSALKVGFGQVTAWLPPNIRLFRLGASGLVCYRLGTSGLVLKDWC